MASREWEYQTVLLRVAESALDREFIEDERARALELLREAYRHSSRTRRSELRKAADDKLGRPPPDWLAELFLRVVATAGLHRWARTELPAELAAMGEAGTLGRWLAAHDPDMEEELVVAGLRHGIGIETAHDRQIIEAHLGHLIGRHNTMAFTFKFDPRALPEGLDVGPIRTDVKAVLDQTVPNLKNSTLYYVLGALSLDGYLGQDRFSQIRRARELGFEAGDSTRSVDPIDPQTGQVKHVLNADAYEAIADEIKAIRSKSNGTAASNQAYFEELTFVARRLLSNANNVPIDMPGLRERVANALNDYVPGQSGGTLSLPALDGRETATADMVSDNIRAVALVYAAWNLEEAKLFQVLDRVTEVFMNGMIPLGNDPGGRALADHYFEDKDARLSEAARRMTYSRVLGVTGGQVSKEAPPNKAFQDLFLRFLASVSEYDRQRRIGDVVGTRKRDDVLSLTGEQVRKSARDLAANASLYGYGGTFFVAQRLASQIQKAMQILNTRDVQSAYGVNDPWQVIERVCATELGGTVPNLVRLRTMAETGKRILDIVAANVPAWAGTSGNDLFFDPYELERDEDEREHPDIMPSTEKELMRSVEHWLAVNGIKDEQRARLGEPELSAPSPSIPSIGGDGSNPAFDQLRQMVSAGQAPSLDQLKALLPDVGGIRL